MRDVEHDEKHRREDHDGHDEPVLGDLVDLGWLGKHVCGLIIFPSQEASFRIVFLMLLLLGLRDLIARFPASTNLLHQGFEHGFPLGVCLRLPTGLEALIISGRPTLRLFLKID